MKFYAVRVGRVPGIYMSWAEADAQIRNFPNARHESFTLREDAEAFLREPAPIAISDTEEEGADAPPNPPPTLGRHSDSPEGRALPAPAVPFPRGSMGANMLERQRERGRAPEREPEFGPPEFGPPEMDPKAGDKRRREDAPLDTVEEEDEFSDEALLRAAEEFDKQTKAVLGSAPTTTTTARKATPTPELPPTPEHAAGRESIRGKGGAIIPSDEPPPPDAFFVCPESTHAQFDGILELPDGLTGGIGNANRLQRRRFSYLMSADLGMASWFRAQHWNSFFSSGTAVSPTFWMLNRGTLMWKRTPVEDVTLKLSMFLSSEFKSLLACLQTNLVVAQDAADKTMIKTWGGFIRRVEAAVVSANREAVLNSTVKALFRICHDVETYKKLDANPHTIVFSNGVLDLHTRQMRAIQYNDFVTYALDYAYDAHADCKPFKQFLKNIYDGDMEAVRALQHFFGYLQTGETDRKHIWQVYAESGAGKTTLFSILRNVMGERMSFNEVPVAELTKRLHFQDGLVEVLESIPRKYVVVCDEGAKDIEFKVEMVNSLSDGKDAKSRRIPLHRKGIRPVKMENVAVKVVLLTNSPVLMDAAETGLINRVTNIAMGSVTFVDEPKAPHHRRKDPALEKFLMSPEARPGIMRFICSGAARYLAADDAERETLIMCPAFVRSTLFLRSISDNYLHYITTNCFPTGNDDDMLYTEELQAALQESRQFPRAVMDSFSGFSNALKLLDTVVRATSVSRDSVSRPQAAYTGLRWRTGTDAGDWFSVYADAEAYRKAHPYNPHEIRERAVGGAAEAGAGIGMGAGMGVGTVRRGPHARLGEFNQYSKPRH
jgi:hypothetical protein